MKKIYLVLFSFVITTTLAQNVVIETSYRSKATLDSVNYVEENFVFTFENDKILKIKELKSNSEKIYPIKLTESFNYYNKSEFVKNYISDVKMENNKDAGMFSIIYTKKYGDLIGVMVNILSDYQTVFYLTKLGKEVSKFDK
jgi:hypothetical protein